MAVRLVIWLAVLAFELSPVCSGDSPITCPNFIHASRQAVDVEITCLVHLGQVPWANHGGEIVWRMHSDSPQSQLQLRPGEQHGRYRFAYAEHANGSVTASLMLKKLEIADFANYTLAMIGPEKVDTATVRLYERGQGKIPFAWWDYVIFGCILIVSAGIGVYYGFFAKTNNTQSEYMLGGRQMGWLPVSLSLLVSFMSAITILGTPSEVYLHGTQYLMVGLSYPLSTILASYLYIPVYYKLGVTSVYEYLEMRFSKLVRLTGAAVFVLQMVIYMSMVVYMPCLALQAVTGLNFWFSALTTAVVCIFYTSLGGMKATVWADAFQATMMMTGLVAILVQGCIREGGMAQAWQRATSRDRTELFEFNPDPRLRQAVWSTVFGGVGIGLATYGVNQAQVQRALSTRSLRTAQALYWLNGPCLILIMLIPGLCGILIFSRYMDCDPIRAGVVTKRDQLLILYVMDVVSDDLPGLPGLFMATLFSAALSTMSSGINGLAAVTCRDFGVERYLRSKGFSERRLTWIAKVISTLYGGLCILLIIIIQHLPGILDAALSLFGVLGGPMLGLFTVGILVPWVNSKGALAGLLSALSLTVWLTAGTFADRQLSEAQRQLSLSTLACDAQFLRTSRATGLSDEVRSGQLLDQFVPSHPAALDSLTGIESFYSISYLYLTLVAVMTTIAVALIVSAVTGWTRGVELDSRLVHPWALALARGLKLQTWRTPSIHNAMAVTKLGSTSLSFYEVSPR